jgi:hypothetical protein
MEVLFALLSCVIEFVESEDGKTLVTSALLHSQQLYRIGRKFSVALKGSRSKQQTYLLERC